MGLEFVCASLEILSIPALMSWAYLSWVHELYNFADVNITVLTIWSFLSWVFEYSDFGDENIPALSIWA